MRTALIGRFIGSTADIRVLEPLRDSGIRYLKWNST